MQNAMVRSAIILGGVFGLLAVALGAFGAHSLKTVLEANGRVEVWQTGAHYQMVHALGLLLVAVLGERGQATRGLQSVVWLWSVGIVLFAGSLYLLAVTNVGWLGAITPLGGVCFLIGWGLVIAAGVNRR